MQPFSRCMALEILRNLPALHSVTVEVTERSAGTSCALVQEQSKKTRKEDVGD